MASVTAEAQLPLWSTQGGSSKAQRAITNRESSSFGFETMVSICIFSLSLTPSTAACRLEDKASFYLRIWK
jgi:hypothetical protein